MIYGEEKPGERTSLQTLPSGLSRSLSLTVSQASLSRIRNSNRIKQLKTVILCDDNFQYQPLLVDQRTKAFSTLYASVSLLFLYSVLLRQKTNLISPPVVSLLWSLQSLVVTWIFKPYIRWGVIMGNMLDRDIGFIYLFIFLLKERTR